MTDRPPVAARQAGVFTRAQAREAGWSDDRIRRRLRTGDWVWLLGRGLVGAGTPQTVQSLAWAAHLTVPDGVISHRTAGLLAGFPLPDGDPLPVHLLAGRHHPMPGLVIHRMPLPEQDRASHDRLPVTTRARTAIDCLADLSPDEALRLWAWLRSRSVLDEPALARAVRERFGRPGTPELLRLLGTVRGGAASHAERRLHRFLRRSGIDGWVAGAKIRDGSGRVVAEVDVLFERERLVIEMDGYEAHSGRAAFVSDRRRERLLADLGYQVLRVTWADLDELPEELARQIRSALARARRHPSRP